jgi:hypothetical protein
MLEIGVDRGGSLKMWQSYFSNATIFGVDIDSSYSSEEERVHIYKGDQSDVGFLNQVKQQVRGISPLLLDLLIDDGSHVPEHQVGTILCRGSNARAQLPSTIRVDHSFPAAFSVGKTRRALHYRGH